MMSTRESEKVLLLVVRDSSAGLPCHACHRRATLVAAEPMLDLGWPRWPPFVQAPVKRQKRLQTSHAGTASFPHVSELHVREFIDFLLAIDHPAAGTRRHRPLLGGTVAPPTSLGDNSVINPGSPKQNRRRGCAVATPAQLHSPAWHQPRDRPYAPGHQSHVHQIDCTDTASRHARHQDYGCLAVQNTSLLTWRRALVQQNPSPEASRPMDGPAE